MPFPRKKRFYLALLVLLFAIVGVGRIALPSSIDPDEEVVFFPTNGHLDKDGKAWVLQVRGWIFEPEVDSRWRKASLTALAKTLGIEAESIDRKRFNQRAGQFLVDNERGQKIRIALGATEFKAGASEANGHFDEELRISAGEAGEVKNRRWLSYKAVMPEDSKRKPFAGRVQLLAPKGLSVISDIDDTIKVSEVLDKRKLLENTFLKPFKAAEGMADLYRRWEDKGAVFHYVSSSPWQLYPALAAFIEEHNFPAGSFHLRLFRVKDRSLANLFKSSEKTKPPEIEPLLKAYPGRSFILCGDSGEQDPEIYGKVARGFKDQVKHIYIRDVLKDGMREERKKEAFKDISPDRWTVFAHPKEIQEPQGESPE